MALAIPAQNEFRDIGAPDVAPNKTPVVAQNGVLYDANGNIIPVVTLADLSGSVAQIQHFQIGTAVTTGVTQIPMDNTVPQNNEGSQMYSVTITPKDATNSLLIEVVINASASTGTTGNMTVALFQDSIVNALAAQTQSYTASFQNECLTIRHKMVAGSTSPITFKVRLGSSAVVSSTMNGQGASGLYGGVLMSSITVTEIRA